MGKIISNGIEYTGSSGSGVSSWDDLQNKPTNIAYIDEETETVDVETPVELTRDDIVNNLNSVDTTKALSAKQGFVLNNILTDIVGADIAEYSEDATYTIGDYCIYLNTLYRCHTAITIPIAWDGSNHWEATTFSNEISELNRNLANLSIDTLLGGINIIQATGDCVEAIKTATHMVNILVTGATTTNLPSSATVSSLNFNYSIGFVLRRTSTQFSVQLYSYKTTYVGVGSLNNGSWSGWDIK